jgi:cobalt/nickel transport system ATP-binding protein
VWLLRLSLQVRQSIDLYLISEVTERCVLMNKGRIVADKPTSELIRDEYTLKRYGMEATKM